LLTRFSLLFSRSSFINSILGEVRNLSGTTQVRGGLAFFSQTPFILNATVKANILFSHVNEPVDEQRYQRAVECCALTHDLNLLSGGDQTEIGEKGITLSGGQKARVALARAVYHGADISLIDDALSAVDAHVAKHLFQQCIVEELMQGKTLAGESGETGKRSVILATNALQHLSHPRVDKVVVLREGRIAEQGSYAELSNNPKSEFSRFLAVIDETGVVPDYLPELDDTDDIVPDEAESPPRKQRSSQTEGDKKAGTSPEKDLRVDKENTSGLMTKEQRATGHVGSDVYFSWAKASGGAWVPFAIVFAYGLVECINVSSKWWLTYWSEHGSEGSQMHFLGIYALINLTAVVTSFFRLVLIMLCGLRASRKVRRQNWYFHCNVNLYISYQLSSLS
jgi:ATP-binding cassette subfamily C (CFTR/MRP) protein 1